MSSSLFDLHGMKTQGSIVRLQCNLTVPALMSSKVIGFKAPMGFQTYSDKSSPLMIFLTIRDFYIVLNQ